MNLIQKTCALYEEVVVGVPNWVNNELPFAFPFPAFAPGCDCCDWKTGGIAVLFELQFIALITCNGYY
jgi:hypothetical protein